MGDTLGARNVAKKILAMPVKVPSETVSNIQEEMKYIISH